MAEAPETRFARSGDVYIAYQIVGDGPIDLMAVPSWMHHLELAWDLPDYARFLTRLGSFARLIIFDRRGTGLSDPVPIDDLPDLETQVQDALVVLDAAEAERPALLGMGEGGAIATLLAAMYPGRFRALMLTGWAARRIRAPDYPWGMSEEMVEGVLGRLSESLVTGASDAVAWLAPSRADDEHFVRQWTRYGRSAVRPGAVKHYFGQVLHTDLRDVLPALDIPTLIVQRLEDKVSRPEDARYLADHIKGAKLVELPGTDHLEFTEGSDALLDEIEEFLTGARSTSDHDRVLATLLFTDIVGSTDRAAELGDRRWRDVLDAHDAAVRRELERFHGREIATTGDGFFATLDGPARAVRCAHAIIGSIKRVGLEIRAGVHTGECEVRGDNLGGLAVHIGARIAALASPGEVLVSSTVKDLAAGSGLEFDDRGAHELKGAPGTWQLYAARAS